MSAREGSGADTAPDGGSSFPHEQRDALRALVLRAGAEMLEAATHRDEVVVHHKGRVNLVTEVDHRLQSLLVEELQRRHPHDVVVAEEGDAAPVADPRSATWYVDPLDGTTNFVHGYPFYCVSVARWRGGAPEVAMVYAPELDELFVAQRGLGATLERPARGGDATPLRCSSRDRLQDALLATGFPYDRGRAARLALSCSAYALHEARGLRRAGSAALDLCYVAAGRLDGFFELTLSPWDVAAGALLVTEAGGLVSDFAGGVGFLEGGRICAATRGVHAELLSMLERAHAQPERWPLGTPFSGPVPLQGDTSP